ncbi:VWA domain-containing protein [Sulfurospirillum diekertiae]|uniref:VWA domain-containing protein n=1 Tax=Sulfurospirillum diekertiae TaxID=1854492 RepID=A0A6G9VTJ2_9BACT|nr:VWA domain-containing protein [Sulfurospirillum diekertiae]QIR75687.1 VWA domain-containing protein [Sulfurospirillum diekertiae]QIR78334.1 VWA domain-containing protein [Sulfurospirillum diekertiae]
MEFLNPEAFWALLALLPFSYFLTRRSSSLESLFAPEIFAKISFSRQSISRRSRNVLMLLAMSFVIIALARPVLKEGEITVDTTSIDVVVGFDLSASMFSDDVYPSRFALAQQKFDDLLNVFPEANVAVIGFSSQGFLVAPLSRDFHTLRFLVEHMNARSVSQKGTNILSALQSAENLMKESTHKALILLTDGGDTETFDKEIAYAKTHGIKVYVYAIGTEKGGAIKGENGMLTDAKGNVVITHLNESIKQLALQSDGAYLHYSLRHDDIKAMVEDIRSKFKSHTRKSDTIHAYQELFYYPLMFGILFLLLSLISLPQRKIHG